jgi:hypothetical protein
MKIMSTLQQTGKMLVKYDTQHVSDKFAKREFVIEIAEENNGTTYTNFAKFQCVQNKCDILDRFKVGDMVTVSFNIKGNRWERDGKVNYISNLDAWRVELANNQQGQQGQQQAAPQPNNYGASGGQEIDELPF